jgi:hypothetical protein
MTCFEVLDFDSLTYVKVAKKFVNVTCLIYKKVTVKHNQLRQFGLSKVDDKQVLDKSTNIPEMPWWYLNDTAASDKYTYVGTRTVEYILCLVVGSGKYTISLGTVTITTDGKYDLVGKYQDIVEDSLAPEEDGPNIVVTGNRLYSAVVNCGKEVVTFSYDVEEPSGSFSENIMFQTDTPINAEDYNNTKVNTFWTKKNKIVGVIDYLGKYNISEFPCDKFPDKVMAVNYVETEDKRVEVT